MSGRFEAIEDFFCLPHGVLKPAPDGPYVYRPRIKLEPTVNNAEDSAGTVENHEGEKDQ